MARSWRPSRWRWSARCSCSHPDGHKLKALRWRSNAVQAKVGGSVQLFTGSDRFEDWYSDWQWAPAGRVSSARTTNFLASEQVRIKSRSYRFIDIKHC